MKHLLLTGVFALSAASLTADVKSQGPKPSDTTVPREITPSAIPSTKDHNSFFFTGDFIYWTAQEGHLLIGTSGTSVLGKTVSKESKTAYINSDYDPGFKFGAGVDLMYDGWDTYMNYTWFSNTNLKGKAQSSTDRLFKGKYFTTVDSISGTWNLYFNNIDWSLGRNFWVSNKLTLHPHVGLKGSWLHQNFDTSEIYSYTKPGDSYSNRYQKTHFWGVGLRAGLDTEWFLTKGLSIYGDFAFSELSGHFKTHTKAISLDREHGILTPTLTESHSSDIHQILPVIELALGLRYEISFGENDWYRFMIQTGWEQQVWWNQNKFGANDGDLTFQGLDVKAGFAF